jgi:hypothetical protein
VVAKVRGLREYGPQAELCKKNAFSGTSWGILTEYGPENIYQAATFK